MIIPSNHKTDNRSNSRALNALLQPEKSLYKATLARLTLKLYNLHYLLCRITVQVHPLSMLVFICSRCVHMLLFPPFLSLSSSLSFLLSLLSLSLSLFLFLYGYTTKILYYPQITSCVRKSYVFIRVSTRRERPLSRSLRIWRKFEPELRMKVKTTGKQELF